MKNILILCGFFFVVSTSPVFALSFDVYESGDSEINEWIVKRGGQVTVLEDFESQTAAWFTTLDTGVGTFNAYGDAGTGATSYNAVNTYSAIPYFSVQEQSGKWYGRYDTTDGINETASKWLDSGDITLLTLTGIDSSLKNLFFYLQDPSDVGATTTVGTGTSTSKYIFNPRQNNGMSFFVGITLSADETLGVINWQTSKINDGYGLDDFSTVAAPVPEPSTLISAGILLAGLVVLRNRKKK
jgi:hypothetical protein